MSIEELMAKYKAGGPKKAAPPPSRRKTVQLDSDDSSNSEISEDDDDDVSGESDSEANENMSEMQDGDEADKLNESFGLKSLLEEECDKNQTKVSYFTLFYTLILLLHINHFR